MRISADRLRMPNLPRIPWQRITASLVYYAKGLYQRIGQDHLLLLSGGLTFSVFVCIIPFILILFSILGTVLETSSFEEQINVFIDRMIPYQIYAATVKEVIHSRIEEFIAHKEVAGYIGIFGLLFAASGLFSSMRTILNTIYRVREDKSIVVEKFRDLMMVLAVLTFFLLSTQLLPAVEIVKDASTKVEFLRFFRMTAIQRFLVSAFSFLIVLTLLYVLYTFIPYERVGKRVAAVSALSGAVLWEIAKQLFGYYITQVGTLGRVYGSYVLIVVIAFWIYYSSLVFIVGAEIGELYRERRMR